MRHGHKGNHLGRTKEHRRALLRNLACSLIEHKRIFTTLAKAKALRSYIEPLVTRAKTNTTHNRRVVFSYLQSKEAIKELFGPVAAEVGDRPGGYVRVIRTGFRKGDGAEMAMIEFVDFNKDYNPKEGKSTGRRRRRRGKGKGSTAEATTPVAETPVAASAEEEVVETSTDDVEAPSAEAPAAEQADSADSEQTAGGEEESPSNEEQEKKED
ncbi:MAG: hypothetical protein KatS3mg030_256 [Saprospiraceae bacterium]|nr:MAG: hypothetical protein KatS3mg030_256 [Saprospiraceae bacterium]